MIIELDSSGHYTPYQMFKDSIRTEKLKEMDLTVIRICNLDIDNIFHNVCEYIDTLVKSSLPPVIFDDSPLGRGGRQPSVVYSSQRRERATARCQHFR